MTAQTEQIYTRYMDSLERVTGRGTWLDTGAVRLAMLLAIDDAHAAGSCAGQAAVMPTNEQIDRLQEYLILHGHASEELIDASPAAVVATAIATIGNLVLVNSRPNVEAQLGTWLAANLDVMVDGDTPGEQALGALTYYHDMAGAQEQARLRALDKEITNEIELAAARKAAAALRAELQQTEQRALDHYTDLANERQTAALLRAEVEQLRIDVQQATTPPVRVTPAAHGSNGNGRVASPFDFHLLSTDTYEFWQGMDRGSHTFRRLPLHVRLEMIQLVLAGQPRMTMADFDSRKPEWMPGASGLTKTFRCAWTELPSLSPLVAVEG